MGKRHLVLGIALILIGGAGLFLLSGGVGRGPDPDWVLSMMGPAIPTDIRYDALIAGEYEQG